MRQGPGVCACGLRLPCLRSEHPSHPEVEAVEYLSGSSSEPFCSVHSNEEGCSVGLSPRGATATTASSKGQKRPDEPSKYCYAWPKNFSTCSDKNPDCAPAPDPTPFSCENKTAKRCHLCHKCGGPHRWADNKGADCDPVKLAEFCEEEKARRARKKQKKFEENSNNQGYMSSDREDWGEDGEA